MPKKETKSNFNNNNKRSIIKESTNNKMPIWDFSNIDNDGPFKFTSEKIDVKLFLKILDFSKLTWQQIRAQTHDKGKSSNHYLDYEGISKKGKDRIKIKIISDDDIDMIFSLRLNNLPRLIGLKRYQVFEVIWYDKNHEFYPAKTAT